MSMKQCRVTGAHMPHGHQIYCAQVVQVHRQTTSWSREIKLAVRQTQRMLGQSAPKQEQHQTKLIRDWNSLATNRKWYVTASLHISHEQFSNI